MADLKISQLPTFTPPLQNTDLFPVSQFIGTPGAQTNKVPWGNIVSQIGSTIVPLTTKGDILGFSTLAARVPIGVNNALLQADSGQALGLKWGNLVNQDLLTSSNVSFVNINSGSSGTAGQINIFPATASSGSFQFIASNSTGGFTSIVTNANVGQSTIYNIPDAGKSNTNFILKDALGGMQTINGELHFVTDWDGSFSTAPLFLQGATDGNKQLYLGLDTNINAGILRAVWESVEDLEIKLNPGTTGGFISVNIPLLTAAQSCLDLNADLSLGAITTPSTPRANTGKLYPKTDGFLYFLNAANVESALTGPSVGQWTASGNLLRPTATGTINEIQLIALTTNTGSLKFLSASNAGNTDTTITNASYGQDSTLTIPDVGGPVGKFILSNSTASQVINSDGSIDLTAANSVSLTSTGASVVLTSPGQVVFNAPQIILNASSSTTVFNQLYIDDAPLYISSSGNPLFKLQWDDTHSGMVADSLDGIGGSAPWWIDPTGGKVGFSFSASTALQSVVNVNGDIFGAYISTPSTPSTGGKTYWKSDGNYYGINASGTEVNITGGRALVIVTTAAPTYSTTGNEDIIYMDTSASAVSVIVNTTLHDRDLKIMNLGLVGGTVTPAATNFINSSAFSKNLTNPFDFMVLCPSSSASNMYVFGSKPLI